MFISQKQLFVFMSIAVHEVLRAITTFYLDQVYGEDFYLDKTQQGSRSPNRDRFTLQMTIANRFGQAVLFKPAPTIGIQGGWCQAAPIEFEKQSTQLIYRVLQDGRSLVAHAPDPENIERYRSVQPVLEGMDDLLTRYLNFERSDNEEGVAGSFDSIARYKLRL
jgi:hypothetical protein